MGSSLCNNEIQFNFSCLIIEIIPMESALLMKSGLLCCICSVFYAFLCFAVAEKVRCSIQGS